MAIVDLLWPLQPNSASNSLGDTCWSQARKRRRVGRAATSRKTTFVTETTTSNSSKDQVSGGEDNPVGLSMKSCSESRMEAAPQNLLSLRTVTQVVTWNVRTMYEIGKSAQIAAEMWRYKRAVLGLCVTRWTRSGQ